MNKILVLGLGKFGHRLITELASREGVRVFAVDKNEKARQASTKYVHECFGANLDHPESLGRIMEKTGPVDTAVLGMGGSMNATTLTALHLRQRGVGRIFIKAEDEQHAEVLNAIDRGMDGPHAFRIIIPEIDQAAQIAGRVATDLVKQEVSLGDNWELAELSCPDRMCGKSLAELEVRQRYQLTIIGWRESGDSPLQHATADTILPEGCEITAVGEKKDIARFVAEFDN
ncbi:MAG: TrkA C-terminal domain-containing protein [Planctomycetota bacterium]|nr:TrkA C-terminal domain-containing protein [Planctomycetota bacterium]